MQGRRGIIVAVSPEGVIGVGGGIPWRYGADLQRFKRLTTGATVIMGRRTFESMGSKPLRNRRNVVVTRATLPGVECFRDLQTALAAAEGPVWFIGGAAIYREAMDHADFIDVTYVPDNVDDPDAVRFPPIDPTRWEAGPLLVHEDDARLTRRVFERKR